MGSHCEVFHSKDLQYVFINTAIMAKPPVLSTWSFILSSGDHYYHSH